MIPRQKKTQGERPEERLERMYQMALKNREKKDPKTWFMGEIRKQGYNSGFAEIFGTSNRDEYLDAAETWCNRRQKKDTQDLPQKVQPKLIKRDDLTDLTDISRSLSNLKIKTIQVVDPNLKRSATVAYLESTIGGFPSKGDFENIKVGITAPGFVGGVTDFMPYEWVRLLPWQRVLTKRSLLVYPKGKKDFKSCEYAYVGKGMRFSEGETGEFDLISSVEFFEGKELSHAERVDFIVKKNGLLDSVPRIKEMLFGVDYVKARKEFGMMVLAINRRLREDVGIDDPVFLGRYASVTSPAGRPQGFTVTRIRDKGRRGDEMINTLNQISIGRILEKHPEKMKQLVDGAIQGIDKMYEKIQDETLASDLERAGLHPMYAEIFKRILDKTRKDLENFSKSKEPDRFERTIHAIQLLSTCGVGVPEFYELTRPGEVDEDILTSWRRDIEQIYVGAGLCNRFTVEHGIAHEQTYSGNIRYTPESGGKTSLTICDWHDSHDLLEMTYPQALGYIAISFVNLLRSAHRTQTSGLFKNIKPDMVMSALKGFLFQTPAYEYLSQPIDPQLVEAIKRDSTTLDPMLEGTHFQANIEAVLIAGFEKPVTEINHPLFHALKQVYSPKKHEQLKRRYGM